VITPISSVNQALSIAEEEAKQELKDLPKRSQTLPSSLQSENYLQKLGVWRQSPQPPKANGDLPTLGDFYYFSNQYSGSNSSSKTS